jgi:hypothetical protein
VELGHDLVQVLEVCACVLLGCMGQPHVPIRESREEESILRHRGWGKGTILPGSLSNGVVSYMGSS